MNQLPLVTIVTPSYNQADFLEHTLQTVLGQDYPRIEYFVIDGGSQDGSVEIIQKYASRLAGWVSERDSGQAEAINKGMQRANGDIVAWLNSDDLYLPGAVRQAVAALQAHAELGFVFGNALTIDPYGQPLNPLTFGDWGLKELMGFRIICQPAVFMRRQVLEKAGYLKMDFHYMLDHHLWLRMARLAPIQHVPSLLAAARHHPSAKNVSQAPGFGRETLRVLAWMQSDPDFAALAAQNRRYIAGGAYRLNARYLLDGGLARQALHGYAQALLADPAYAARHWRRILFALASSLGLKRMGQAFARMQPQRNRPLISEIKKMGGIQGWPGVKIEP